MPEPLITYMADLFVFNIIAFSIKQNQVFHSVNFYSNLNEPQTCLRLGQYNLFHF